jgi:N-acetylglucosaminyldiphosphoundecaprenol N-acetyl-beta-D-mannosaminyltransferase
LRDATALFALHPTGALGCTGAVESHFRSILGVRFFIADLQGLLAEVAKGKGLVVFPSAPVMVRLEEDPAHRQALEGADFAVTDSALMVLLWLARTGERIRRISGLRFLRAYLTPECVGSAGRTFWVMPSTDDAEANRAWLASRAIAVDAGDVYIAPHYPRAGDIEDEALLAAVQARRPQVIFVCLSGGVQERLGWFLRKRMGASATILCVGGAIAFLSGRQNAIPVWADRLGLGWLLRLIAAPRSFSQKVSRVGRIFPLIWRYRGASVPDRHPL